MSFAPAKAKLTIGSLDDSTTVSAQYNPKELQVDQSIPWSKKNAANQSGAGGNTSAQGGIELEFTDEAPPPRITLARVPTGRVRAPAATSAGDPEPARPRPDDEEDLRSTR